ncbi:MAG: hypothetical protein NUV73_01590 [Candidatus Daviesbacteria bacterium]|nr:hypothetical protein [Candidatus Daviesbacteria bacterium]
MALFDFVTHGFKKAKDDLIQSRFNVVNQVRGTIALAKPAIRQGVQRVQQTPKSEFFLPTAKAGYTGLQQLPTLNVAKKIQNPIGRVAATIGQDIINTPVRTGQAVGRIGQDFRQGTTTAPRLIGNVASIAETPLTFATFGSGAVVKSLIKQGGKGAVKLAVKEGAKTGAKVGGTFGLLQGLGANRESNNVFEQFIRSVPQAAGGALLGGVFGGGISAGSATFNKLVSSLTKKGVSQKQAISMVGGYLRDRATGKFARDKSLKEPIYYGELDKLGPISKRIENVVAAGEKRVGLQVRDINKDKLIQKGIGGKDIPGLPLGQKPPLLVDLTTKQQIQAQPLQVKPATMGGGQSSLPGSKVSSVKGLPIKPSQTPRIQAQQPLAQPKPLEVKPQAPTQVAGGTGGSSSIKKIEPQVKQLEVKSPILKVTGTPRIPVAKTNRVSPALLPKGQGSVSSKLNSQSKLPVRSLEEAERNSLFASKPRPNANLEGVLPKLQTQKVIQGKSPLQQSGQTALGQIPKVPGSSFDDIIRSSSTNVKNKVGIIDEYLRTPDRVYKKIGLEKEFGGLRQAEDAYLKELPIEINKITEWSKQVSPDASLRIFRYLDDQAPLTDPTELKVAREVKTYLEGWADRLGLPKDRRITNYITHIFDKDFITKEFDDDLAKLIQNKVAGSVYDPFTLERLGKLGYKEDVWQALDAYVKRGVRKVNFDPALEKVKAAAENLEISQFNYVKKNIDKVNMRPSELDTQIDNTIKQIFGYRFGARPVTALSKTARQWVFRATLGLNPASALKNLTQGANTYAKLGEKYTLIGYMKAIKNLATGSKELQDVGILKDNFIQDRTFNATKKFWEKVDKGLFIFFDTAEKINRGAAYFGAKSKALSAGKSEQEAIEFAKKIVRDTQFKFGALDTPPILQSDIGKTLLQFQSFSLKQAEFLGEMVQHKDIAGLLRWSAASLGMVYTVGKLIGMEPKDLIPTFRIGVPPTLKIPAEIGKALVNAPNKYGETSDETNPLMRVYKSDELRKSLPLLVPAGTQIKKTYEGLSSYNEGVSTTPTGRIRFKVDQTPGNLAKSAIFGQYSTEAGQKYIQNLGKSKSEILANDFKKLKTKEEKTALWNQYVKEGKITKENVSDIKKQFEDQRLEVRGKEKTIRGLPVQDGSRARAIIKEFDKLDTSAEKKALWNRYVELGIITKDVAKQLKGRLK